VNDSNQNVEGKRRATTHMVNRGVWYNASLTRHDFPSCYANISKDDEKKADSDIKKIS
jgi:hypothetical protein